MKHRNAKRIAVAALLVIVLLAACGLLFFGGEAQPQKQQGNLIENGDFSAVTEGMPDGWNTGMWVTSAGASYLEAVTLEDGTNAVLVENAAENDARFEQTVAVQENSTYKLTAYVRAEGADAAKTGANVSFLGIYGTSRCAYDTDGEFEEITLYAQTGKGQTEATVCLRLGGYGSENVGRAWFKDVSLTQVNEAPVGETVLNIATPKPQKESAVSEDEPLLDAVSGGFLMALIYAAGMAYMASRLMRRSLEKDWSSKRQLGSLAIVLGLGAALRLILAPRVPGYDVDMGCFGAWAAKMASGGPANFYEEGYFCDYPPAYMLVLGLLGSAANAMGISLGGMDGQFLLKTAPILCDILCALLVYLAARKALGCPAALTLCTAVALNPAYFLTSACWGQIDSVLAVLLIILLLAAQEGKWHAAIPVFALAVLAKPQAGLLAPLGVAALARDVMGRGKEKARRSALMGLAGGVAVTLMIALPFSANQSSAFWLADKYVETLSSYDYATLSTGNLMFLLGGNWVKNTEAVLGPITYGQLGMALMALSFAAGVIVYLRGKERENLFLASAVTMQLIYVLGSKMHERYILPALVLLFLAYVETRDVRLLISGVLASAAAAVNILIVLRYDYLIAPNLWAGYILSIVQIFASALTVWAAADRCLGRAPVLIPAVKTRETASDVQNAAENQPMTAAEKRMREELLHAQDYRLHLKKRDWAIMLSLTAVYAAVGFYHLGATSAPQTGYASTAAGETVVFDLGETQENFRIYYYGGISDTQFSFAVSDDGITYGEENDAFFDRGECFKWMALRNPSYDESGTVTGASGGMLIFSGRYLRVTFKGAGASLWEVAAVTADGEAIPMAGVSASGALEGRGDDAVKLCDEQDTVPEKPTYYNSMYFDEIYHARTGYEHANALSTYETTHPPLGKVFMSWCIKWMGMTPFAWRFAGALCGVLMIPAIYMLGMTLFGQTRWAALGALLLASDCMHFTQTRIATIDSFPVLFMMVMFTFMARWMKMSFYHQRLGKTFIPLALSGAFMGLAIASKWIGCYGAVGLAVLFFARFYVLWRQSVYARQHENEDPAFARAARLFSRNGALTIGACCVFFVLVPVTIYVLSYIPYLRYYGEIKWNLRTFERIWDAQVLMFDYHKNLVAEHYFASPWYEWPLIVKPMWYYNGDFNGAGMASSILSFGNPAVWWTGLAGILFVLGYSFCRNALPAMRVTLGRDDAYDRAMPVIAVAFLSAYLPWVLVSRLTFIYHYFASVPWIILATVQGLRYLERRRKKTARGLAIVLGVAAVALFIGFYPLASGMEVPRAWCDAMSWFDNWMWY